MTEQTDRWGKQQQQVAELLLGGSEVLRSLRHYLRAQSQRPAHLRLQGGWRSKKKDSTRRSSLKRRVKRYRTITYRAGTVLMAINAAETYGETGVGAHMGCPERVDTTLQRTELS